MAEKVTVSLFGLLAIAAVVVIAGLFIAQYLSGQARPLDGQLTTNQAASSPAPIQVPQNQIAQASQTQQGPSVGNSVGDLAPDFTAALVDGQVRKLSDYRTEGKPVLLYFFATWCPYCHEDLTTLRSVYPKWQDNVAFLAIDLDPGETSEQIKEYVAANRFVGSFAPLPNSDVLSDYQVIATTTKYAINKDGFVVWKGSGVASSEVWDKLFKALATGE